MRNRDYICSSLTAMMMAIGAAGPALADATTDTVFLPFDNVPPGQVGLMDSPRLELSFNGGSQVEFLMDTGSVGTVASPDNFVPPQGEASLGPGTITYTSSGVVLNGQFYNTLVTIGSGTQTAVAKVPVLQVTSVTCVPNARNCTPNPNPTHVALMGVGFGQEDQNQPDGTPRHNPLLNIIKINGHRVTPERGYILTWQGVTLGLSPQKTRHFRQVPLTWNGQTHDWNRAPLTVSANGWVGTGTALMDTGVSSMYLQVPTGDTIPTIPDQDAVGPCIMYAPCAAPGVVIKVSIGTGASYSFRVGANGIPNPKQKAAPGWVTVLNSQTSAAFVNTTYHFLNRFDYLYDYTFGVVGFRSAKKTYDGG